VVASTSLHHVADLDVALDRLAAVLKPGGTAVVIEWASESFDEATARWCFARLPRPGPGEEPGWLQHAREAWRDSGQPWQAFRDAWRSAEGLHRGEDVLRGLETRFRRRSCTRGPYFFADLAGTTEAAEQAAIDRGEIRATGLRWAGTRPADRAR
jgi:SAM-dependent methyltransferase